MEPIRDLGVHQREVNALARAGILTIGDLYMYQNKSLLEIKGFGFVGLYLLLYGLKSRGYEIPEVWVEEYKQARAPILRSDLRRNVIIKTAIDWEFEP